MAEDDSPTQDLPKPRCNTPVIPWKGAQVHYCEYELGHKGSHSWEHLVVGANAEDPNAGSSGDPNPEDID